MALLWAFTLFLALGLAGRPSHKPHHPPRKLPDNLIHVPLYVQQTDYSCGPSSALALLRYWDYDRYIHVTEQDLYGPMNTSSTSGTDPQPIADYFNDIAKIPALYISGSNNTIQLLRHQIDIRNPAIVDFQAWPDNPPVNWKHDWSDGHYNVLVGYDHENFFLMDPSTQGHYAYIPQSEFIDRWHDIVGKNTKTERMVILVKGTRTPHPVTPKHPDATYEA